MEYGGRYKDNDRLFQGQRGPLTVKTVTQLVKKWCGDIYLKGNLGSHTMRKTWGVHQLIPNVSISIVIAPNIAITYA